MDRGSSATRQSAGVSLSQSQRTSLQRRQLSKETTEAPREECRHPRSDTAGVPAHILHAYPKTRHGQGYAASPEAFGPRDDAKALRQIHSREPARRGRSPGCADHWNARWPESGGGNCKAVDGGFETPAPRRARRQIVSIHYLTCLTSVADAWVHHGTSKSAKRSIRLTQFSFFRK